MTKVTVMITTWPCYLDRLEYLEEVLHSLDTNLITANLDVQYLISTETAGSIYMKELYDLADKYNYEIVEHKGDANIGANLNLALSKSTGDYIIYFQDDFICKEPINVNDDINFFNSNPSYKMIRYYRYSKNECEDKAICDSYYKIPKTTHNYYSDNPHIKTRDFHDIVGMYNTEDNSRGEKNMNKDCKKSDIEIALRKPDSTKVLVDHIGSKSSMMEKWKNHPANKNIKVKHEEERQLISHYNENIKYCTSISPSNYKKTINKLNLNIEGSKVLDIGCGTGKWAKYLASNYKCSVTGIDYSDKRIAEADKGINNLDCVFLVKDANIFTSSTDFRYNIITMFEVIEHLKEPKLLLEQCQSILEPEGCIVGTVPLNKPYKAHLQVYTSVEDIEERLGVKIMFTQGRHVFWRLDK